MPKNIMLEFQMDEISGVNDPAQKGARAVIMKRAIKEGDRVMIGDAKGTVTAKIGKFVLAKADEGSEALVAEEDAFVAKDCDDCNWYADQKARARNKVMTSAVEGHAHLVDLGLRAGETSHVKGEDEDSWHSHPYFVNEDGTVTIGAADGHTHEVDASQLMTIANDQLTQLSAVKSTNSTETVMTEEEKKALEKRAERAEAINKLNADERAYFDELEDKAQDEFLGKGADERKQIAADAKKEKAEKAADADPVVYKADSGEEFRKSDDPRLVSMAKQADQDRRDLAKARAAERQANFEKRAESELKHFPGEVSVRAAILKAVDGIEDDKVKEEAIKSLKAQDAKLGKGFTVVGTEHGGDLAKAEGSDVKKSAEDALEKKAREIMEKSEKPIDFYSAYDQAVEANPDLAEKAIAG